MKKAWFSAAELAVEALPGMPGSRQNIAALALRQGWDGGDKCRARQGRGGGVEYHYTLLPDAAQVALVAKYGALRRELTLVVNNNAVTAPRTAARVSKAVAMPGEAPRSATAWAWYDGLPNNLKDKAVQRLEAVNRIETLRRRVERGAAVRAVAEECGVSVATIHNWLERARGVARADWLPALAPAPRGGGGQEVDIQEEVWDVIRADYLRLAQPSFNSCYRRLERVCAEKGWVLPPERTLRRRIDAIPVAVRVLAREGVDAVKKLYPAQKRDRSMFHAFEAVNADGHRWDVFVRYEDGTIGRPMMLAFQDLYSGKFLSWRYDRAENRDMIRLAFGDMCMSHEGIPDKCWFDNGRAFASKWLTGRIKNRYRFKVKDEDPLGILPQLGVDVRWTTPYHGQSKPIERAWRDFCDDIAKGPWFQGAYTGNSPMAKPEDYASRAIPFEEFKARVDYEIMMHNQRPNRQSDVCGGKLSFNQAFEASFEVAKARNAIRPASPEQIRMCLLAAEAVTARQNDGSIHLLGNRYWNEALVAERGEKLTVRFDPDNVQADLPVYRRDGSMVCVALLVEATGFADTTAAREHAAARNAFVKSQRAMLAAERTLSLADLVALQPKPVPATPQENEIVRSVVHGNLAVKPAANTDDDYDLRLARGRERLLQVRKDEEEQ